MAKTDLFCGAAVALVMVVPSTVNAGVGSAGNTPRLVCDAINGNVYNEDNVLDPRIIAMLPLSQRTSYIPVAFPVELSRPVEPQVRGFSKTIQDNARKCAKAAHVR